MVKIVCAKETCHNRKIEKPWVPFVTTKVVKPIVEVTTQFVKARVPLKYPCIICSSFEHCALDCLRKKKIQTCFELN